MDLVQDVLTDIKLNYATEYQRSTPIDQRDINLIVCVLQEMECSFSANTMQFIETRYIDHNIPETPIAMHTHSKQKKCTNPQIQHANYDQDEDDAESDESFVFSMVSGKAANMNTQNFNVFSFASNETQMSNITQPFNGIQSQDTQMDVDYDDFHFSQFDTNNASLSQSFCELQLNQSEVTQQSGNNNNNRSKHQMSMSLSPSLTHF